MTGEIVCPQHQKQGLYKEFIDGEWTVKCLCAGCSWQREYVYHSDLGLPDEQELRDKWQ